MDNQKTLALAKAAIKEAITLDNDGQYKEAYAKYKNALDRFLLLLKYEKNETVKKELMRHIEQYMDRAEKLKAMIKEGKEKPVGEPSGGGKGDSGGEKNKFEGMLSEAIISEKPNVQWDDVAGLEVAKQTLKEAVILPVKQPQLFFEGEPWKGILLYGPPGTGKSFLAKAIATEADSTFFSVSSADLVSKWQGESEKLIRSLFEMAREKRPSIVFIDEVDSMCGAREEGQSDASGRMKTQFLIQMDGVGPSTSQVLVLGATNLPWSLDIAMRRRFEKRIYIPLPEPHACAILFRLKLKKVKHNISERQFKQLGDAADGYSGADIAIVAREAIMMPVRKMGAAKFFRMNSEGMYLPCEKYPPCPYCPMKLSSAASVEEADPCTSCGAIRINLYQIPQGKAKKNDMTFNDVLTALKNSNPSVGKDELNQYEKWTEEFGQEG